jgi:hypothetical protein
MIIPLTPLQHSTVRLRMRRLSRFPLLSPRLWLRRVVFLVTTCTGYSLRKGRRRPSLPLKLG